MSNIPGVGDLDWARAKEGRITILERVPWGGSENPHFVNYLHLGLRLDLAVSFPDGVTSEEGAFGFQGQYAAEEMPVFVCNKSDAYGLRKTVLPMQVQRVLYFLGRGDCYIDASTPDYLEVKLTFEQRKRLEISSPTRLMNALVKRVRKAVFWTRDEDAMRRVRDEIHEMISPWS